MSTPMAVLLARLFGHPAPPEAIPYSDTDTSPNRSRPRSNTAENNDGYHSRIAPISAIPAPYDTPDPSGRCRLVDLPEEVLVKVFTGLDRISLARCMRVCKTLHDLLSTNPHLALQSLLTLSSLRLNPAALRPSLDVAHRPLSPAELLSRLRDRIDRLGRFDPIRTTTIALQEREGTLYEYLEGVLMKSSSGSRDVGIYDLRLIRDLIPGDDAEVGAIEEGVEEDGEEDWEEVHEGDEVAEKIRRTNKFGFEIAEFAVDPGQDLLVLVEVRTHGPRQHRIHIHLLSLETFGPHPLARETVIDWPTLMTRRQIVLGFQICDDGLYILKHNTRTQPDQICGWQWTTGRLAVTLKAFPTTTFESFILLTPNSFVVPTIVTHLDPESNLQDDITNPADLSWTHHLQLYAFPPFSSTSLSPTSSEPFPPPHTAVHIATFDLPAFVVDLPEDIPPPRMTIRTDPPPRHTFPSHPRDKVQPFAPDPESGVIIVEFRCQMPIGQQSPHYVMAAPKSALIRYLPAPTSPLLTQAFPRQAPVVRWETLAPKVRFFGPDMKPSNWVCYVYQDRYVTSTSTRREPSDPADFNAKVRLYDFSPLRVKREILLRSDTTLLPAAPASSSLSTSPPPPKRRSTLRSISSLSASSAGNAIDGEQRGITLITSETIIRKSGSLVEDVITGREFPYTFAEKDSEAEVFLLDEERVVAVHDSDDDTSIPVGRRIKSKLEVMEF